MLVDVDKHLSSPEFPDGSRIRCSVHGSVLTETQLGKRWTIPLTQRAPWLESQSVSVWGKRRSLLKWEACSRKAEDSSRETCSPFGPPGIYTSEQLGLQAYAHTPLGTRRPSLTGNSKTTGLHSASDRRSLTHVRSTQHSYSAPKGTETNTLKIRLHCTTPLLLKPFPNTSGTLL